MSRVPRTVLGLHHDRDRIQALLGVLGAVSRSERVVNEKLTWLAGHSSGGLVREFSHLCPGEGCVIAQWLFRPALAIQLTASSPEYWNAERKRAHSERLKVAWRTRKER